MFKFCFVVTGLLFTLNGHADSVVCHSILGGAGKAVKAHLVSGPEIVLPEDSKICTIRKDDEESVISRRVIVKDKADKILVDSGEVVLMIFLTETAEYLIYGPSLDYIYNASLKDPAVIRFKCVEEVGEQISFSYSVVLGGHDFLLGEAEFDTWAPIP